MTTAGYDAANWFEAPEHLDFLVRHRTQLLDFYQPEVCLPGAGYAYLDDEGRALPQLGSQLWIGARMLHVFSLAHLLGREGASEVVEHGLSFYLDGDGRDHEYDGWFAVVGGDEPSDRKELYSQAQLLLGASSAAIAGFERGRELLDAIVAVVDKFYWREEDDACVEAYDRTWTVLDPYRGQNANMHLTEALMAAYEATDDPLLLERASRIAKKIAGAAESNEEGSHRLPEHFDENWMPLPDFNRDQPRHPFRPYGSQPGHWLEWAKLIMQMKGLGVAQDWMVPAATNLFRGAMSDGWAEGGGFVYTVDWNGSPGS